MKLKWLRKEEIDPKRLEEISDEIYSTKFFEIEDSTDHTFVSHLSSEIKRVLVDENMNVLAVQKEELIAIKTTIYFLRKE